MKKIQKLSTIEIDSAETTPFVFHGRLYRLEYVRERHKRSSLAGPYHRLIDVATGKILPPFSKGYHLGSAIVDSDIVYVFALKGCWGSSQIDTFYSKDLENWSSQTALFLPGWRIFNNSVCKTDKGYVMAFEIDAPPEETGIPYTVRFAKSKDLLSWELTESQCVYSKERYTACPTVRFFDGIFYMTYLEAKPGPFYETYITRTKDLVRWEDSKLNPLLTPSPEDKRIDVTYFSDIEKDYISKAVNRNNSDIDYCEFNRKTIIYYSWGDQVGHEFLAHAIYDGTLKEFSERYY